MGRFVIFTILGHTGYIGQALLPVLQRGYQVQTFPRQSDRVYREPLGHVIYAVGLTADFRQHPYATVDAHIGYLRTLLERAQYQSFLYLSSTRVYLGADNATELSPLTVRPHHADDLYALSKLTGEALCHATKNSAVRIVRLSNVYGYGMHRHSLLGNLLVNRHMNPIHLDSHPQSAKDYISLQDVIAILPQIAVRGQHTVYNVASGVNVTTQALLDSAGLHATWSEDAPLVTFPPIPITRIQSEFTYHPCSVLDEWPRLVTAC